jgi:hypothetical protein
VVDAEVIDAEVLLLLEGGSVVVGEDAQDAAHGAVATGVPGVELLFGATVVAWHAFCINPARTVFTKL